MFLTLILLLQGCTILEGSNTLAQEEFEKIEQKQIEELLTNGTPLQDQNITVQNSLLDSIKNLQRLNKELENLNSQIEIINSNINSINSTDSNELFSFLNTLNSLTENSKEFVRALRDSTLLWDNYLSSAVQNSNELNFSKEVNETVFVESITKPLEAFKE